MGHKDSAIFFLDQLHTPKREIPEEERNTPFIEEFYKELLPDGTMLASLGVPLENFANAFDFEAQEIGRTIGELHIQEDFMDCKETGLYIWIGNIVYGCSCRLGSCDCGPELNCEVVRRATSQDLIKFDLIKE